MRRKKLVGTILLTFLGIVLVVTLAATYLITHFFVVQNWELYPKNSEFLDLRENLLSLEEFDELSRKLPDTQILWSVPVEGGFVSSDTEVLTITHLTEADLTLPEYFPELKTVDARQCRDYPQLLQMYQMYPDIQVQYVVTIDGEEYGPEIDSVAPEDLTEADVAMLQYLPNLARVDGRRVRNVAMMEQLADNNPQWEVKYIRQMGGEDIDPDAAEAEVTGATYEELYAGIGSMPQLKNILIHDPQADAAQLMELRELYPDVQIRWDVTFCDQTYPDDIQEADISHAPLESIEQARAFGAALPELTKLIVDSGSISNEDMASFREEMREQYKVVWTIVFSADCSARTDTTWFMPIKVGEYYFFEKYTPNLIYLEDVVAMDLGHQPIHTTDFLKYMPHLKYLILTDTQVKEVTNLEYCKELVFLEIDWCFIKDLGNIQECTALEDLSICDGMVDLEVVKQLTWLKHLRWLNRDSGYMSSNRVVEMQEALPDTLVAGSYNKGLFTWRHLDNYYAMRDALGMYYMPAD